MKLWIWISVGLAALLVAIALPGLTAS